MRHRRDRVARLETKIRRDCVARLEGALALENRRWVAARRSRLAPLEAELRFDATGRDRLAGYVVKWKQRSLPLAGGFREEIARGAFSDSIRAGQVIAVMSHDPDLVFARQSDGTLVLHEDAVGLHATMYLGDDELQRSAWHAVRSARLCQCSFSFRVWSDSFRNELAERVRTVHRAELIEVSLVTSPAYPQPGCAVRPGHGQNCEGGACSCEPAGSRAFRSSRTRPPATTIRMPARLPVISG